MSNPSLTSHKAARRAILFAPDSGGILAAATYGIVGLYGVGRVPWKIIHV